MDPQTPAAIVERATTPAQRVVRSVLADLSKTVADRGVRPPALFFIGQTTTLGDQIEWFGGGPLQGRRVMVLRPADQAAMFYKLLRDLGAEILPYPTIATRAVADSNWETVFNLDSPNAWLAFTSENGVRYFMRHLAECGLDQRLLGAFSIAAIGHGTKRALKEHGLTADFMPNKATVSALAHELADSGQVSEAAVVRVEGNLSDDTLPDVLGAAGAEVIRLPVYETYHPEWADGMKARLLERPPHIVMFTSGSTVHGLFECLSADEIEAVIGGATLVSIGPSTTKKIESKGLDVTVEAEEHSLPGMIQAILKHESERELQ